MPDTLVYKKGKSTAATNKNT